MSIALLYLVGKDLPSCSLQVLRYMQHLDHCPVLHVFFKRVKSGLTHGLLLIKHVFKTDDCSIYTFYSVQAGSLPRQEDI